MRILKFVMYILYKYYSKGRTKNVAYFSALGVVAFLITIHVFQLLIITNKFNYLPTQLGDSKIYKYLKVFIFILPIYSIIALLVKPSDIKGLNYDEKRLKTGAIVLIVYGVVNFILLFVFASVFRRY